MQLLKIYAVGFIYGRMIASITTTSAALICVLTVCYLSFIKAGKLGILYRTFGIRGDDIFHVLSFILLAFLLRIMFSTSLYRPAIKNPRIWVAWVTLGISLFIESIQIVMPTRHASLLDIILHASGIAIFFVADMVIENITRRRYGNNP
jgi:glycopeptide antibiotics resistance protein